MGKWVIGKLGSWRVGKLGHWGVEGYDILTFRDWEFAPVNGRNHVEL